MASEKKENNERVSSPWCQLVYTHECRPPLVVSKDTFTFGRSPDCDVTFAGCKFLSGKHCLIMRDVEGKAWLHDTSTNGTVVNSRKIKPGQVVKLCHNDEIKLVHRKELEIGFVYQDLKCLKEEEETFSEITHLPAVVSDEIISTTKDDVSQCSQDKSEQPLVVNTGKRPHQKTASETDSPTAKRQHVGKDKLEEPSGVKSAQKPHSSIADNLMCTICQDIFHDCVSLQPCMHSYCASCYSQWMDRSSACPSCRLKVSRINRNHLVNNLVEAFLKDNPDKKRSKEEIEEMDSKNKITSDMLKPPRRRRSVMGAPRFFPDLEFDDDLESDYDDEDDFSEHTSDMSEYDMSDDDDDDDMDDDFGHISPFTPNRRPFSDNVADLFGFLSRSMSRSLSSRLCRQCPSNVPTSSSPPTTTAATYSAVLASFRCPEGPSGSSGSSTTDGPSNVPDTALLSYTCPQSRSHILCMCCMEYMPDRRSHTGSATDTPVPSQTCSICERAFCHMYWGCGGNCNGCLSSFKDTIFSRNLLDTLINENTYESTIFKNFLTEKGMAVDELLHKCLEKLDSKEYKAKDVFQVTSSTVVCNKCALRNFQELAYQFRRDIPRDELPAFVKNRHDCYWGRNCRTQRTKPHHASRFNHICEQKRFT